MNWPSSKNREAELEAKLDTLPKKLERLAADPEIIAEKQRKKRQKALEKDPKTGRWVAPVLLLVTALIGAILWAFKP